MSDFLNQRDPADEDIAPPESGAAGDVNPTSEGQAEDDTLPDDCHADPSLSKYHPGMVVGLGGSAGSLTALQVFFEKMPVDSGITFVVVTHLLPGGTSLLSDILQRSTTMQVTQVQERVKVEENCVYVIPPSRHLVMTNGHLELSELSPGFGKRIAVDLFFRTLGDTHGPQAIGVILSGADGDGAVGIKRIKECGGLTIVQDPGEAEHEGMPRAAISTGVADWVLSVADIPSRILSYQQSGHRLQLPPEEEPVVKRQEEPRESDGEEALREVLTFLRMRTDRNFSYYKRATILRRIGRRMQVNGIDTMEQYLHFLRTHQGEAEALLQDLLISVTNFFRDRESFAALQEDLPHIFEGKKAGDQIRVWVAGCATGEEAYSLAILLTEYADTLNDSPSLQIFATDLDETALQHARLGVYPETIAADVSEERLRRFFHREEGRLRVRTEIRERVLFSLHDVFRDAPFSRLDLVSCRNLFIYVNREMQRRAFDLFHFALNPGGRLFLGSAESADDVGNLFNPLNKKHRIYVRSATVRNTPVVSPGPSFAPALPGPQALLHKTTAAGGNQILTAKDSRTSAGYHSWRDLHFEFLDGIAPASVLVNSEYEIVHLSEHAGSWLKLSPGEPKNDLLEMVSPGLRVNLRTALFRAKQDGGIVEMPCMLSEKENEKPIGFRLRVRALPRIPGFFLVAFDQPGLPAPENARIQPVEEQWTVRQLEEELKQTRHRLRDLEEQHRASLEELKAGNEELQSMNEELRSAGEELETGREELQSINEELQTVNHELKARVEELSGSNSDLLNLMASTNIATIFLDRELRIKKYTPPAMALFNFIPSDLGRPLSDLTNRLEYPGITSQAQSVLKDLVPIEQEVKAGDRWFLARLQPYRTLEDRIGGIVLTFVDVTALKKVEGALVASKEHLRLIFENAREYAIFSMDPERRITSWNSGAERLLGYMEAEILGQVADVIFTPEDRNLNAPRKEAETALLLGRAADERWHLRRDGSRFWGSGVMMAMRDEDGNSIGLVKILRDQTREQMGLEDLKKARADAEAAGQAKDHFLAVLSHELRTPLSPVVLGIDMLLEEEGLSPSVRQSLEMVSRNVKIETQLIDDLLDVTRIARGKLEIIKTPIGLHDVLRKAMQVCSIDLESKNLEISIALDAKEDRILGDETRLQQLFWNLLKNAAKFTPPDGKISVRSRNDNHSIFVEVIDSGIGIAPERLELIFDSFTQGGTKVTRKYGGLGLGLAICKAVVTAHGGTIHAQSKGVDQGSSFMVCLPLKPRKTT